MENNEHHFKPSYTGSDESKMLQALDHVVAEHTPGNIPVSLLRKLRIGDGSVESIVEQMLNFPGSFQDTKENITAYIAELKKKLSSERSATGRIAVARQIAKNAEKLRHLKIADEVVAVLKENNMSLQDIKRYEKAHNFSKEIIEGN